MEAPLLKSEKQNLSLNTLVKPTKIFIQEWSMLKMFQVLFGLAMSFQIWYNHLTVTIHPTPYGTRLTTGAQGSLANASTLHVTLDKSMMQENQKRSKLLTLVTVQNSIAKSYLLVVQLFSMLKVPRLKPC